MESLDNLAAAETCEEAFRKIVEACSFAFDSELYVFLSTDDASGPHKSRVALRRLTTALDAFAPLLRKKRSDALRGEAKAIFRALGEIRDQDVFIANHPYVASGSGRVEKIAREREKMRRRLRRDKAVTFAPRLRQAVQEGGEIYSVKPKALAVRATSSADFAATSLQTIWDNCMAFGADLGGLSVKQRHDFRKSMKSARYLVEFFSPYFDVSRDDPFMRLFRRLQDQLGVLNDFEVARHLDRTIRSSGVTEKEQVALIEAERAWQQLRSMPLPWTVATPTQPQDVAS